MNTQEARIAGENAYYDGESRTMNPFNSTTDGHRYSAWDSGYLQAQEQDDPS